VGHFYFVRVDDETTGNLDFDDTSLLNFPSVVVNSSSQASLETDLMGKCRRAQKTENQHKECIE
jgi:hypothetical protein